MLSPMDFTVLQEILLELKKIRTILETSGAKEVVTSYPAEKED